MQSGNNVMVTKLKRRDKVIGRRRWSHVGNTLRRSRAYSKYVLVSNMNLRSSRRLYT